MISLDLEQVRQLYTSYVNFAALQREDDTCQREEDVERSRSVFNTTAFSAAASLVRLSRAARQSIANANDISVRLRRSPPSSARAPT